MPNNVDDFLRRHVVDHKELLRKYINHVGLCEGSVFLNDYNREYTKDYCREVGSPDDAFTDAEWEELKKLSE